MEQTLEKKIKYFEKQIEQNEIALRHFIMAKSILDKFSELADFDYQQNMDYGKLIHDICELENNLESNKMFLKFLQKDFEMQEQQKKKIIEEMNSNYSNVVNEVNTLLNECRINDDREVSIIKTVIGNYNKGNRAPYEYGLLLNVLKKYSTLKIA